MLFNSIDFIFFLIFVLVTYWSIPRKYSKAKVILLLVSSYFFYACWDWRFLSLIVFSSLVDYIVGLKLYKAEKKRKLILSISLICNLGLLFVFKYFNFFIDSFNDLFKIYDDTVEFNTLDIILPVGISFYTFQTLSYSLDIYKGKLKPVNEPLTFFCYVAFFPQLVAGPIERARNLLPQLQSLKGFDKSKFEDGLRQIVWGMFKKIVIADNCGYHVNDIFANVDDSSASTLIVGAVYFSLQIYADFSGYTDIAIGTAKLFNIDFNLNFKYPYFSRNISEFWRRWHISLSSWFRDYLYFPLGGNREGKWKHIRNLFVIFAVSGLWHGANFTFVVWGVLHFIYYLPEVLLKLNRRHIDFDKLKIIDTVKILYTFIIVTLAFVFFRAENITHGWNYIRGIFENQFSGIPSDYNLNVISVLISFMFIVEWFNKNKDHGLAKFNIRIVNSILLLLTFFMLLEFGMFRNPADFIYFNF